MTDDSLPSEVPVLIVGAGSVGLALAAELGWRGVRCFVIERHATLNSHPRANAVANRTMEYFRRWGIDQQVTQSGIGPDLPARYLWLSKLNGRELYRIELPGHRQLIRGRGQGQGRDANAEHEWSPYLKTTTGQNHVERAMIEFVQRLPAAGIRFNTELLSFEADEKYVTASLLDTINGTTTRIRCQYLVACDGGRSTVREAIASKLEGRGSLAKFVSIYFRSPQFSKKCRFGHANIYFPLHRDFRGFILNWDGGAEFTYHLVLKDGQAWNEVDPLAAIEAVLGEPVEIKLIDVQPWTAHALVAQQYRRDRVFLCGDAAHLFTPTGGFGMNTGISDAIDLAWKLQACLGGWGGEQLLDSYQVERRPIGVRNTQEAADCFDRLDATMQYGDELDEDSPASDKLRNELGEELGKQAKLISSSGTLLGYRYEHSPVIVDDGSVQTPDDARHYVPTARPGHRAPHYWLDSNVALFDQFSADFTLLQLDPSLDLSALVRAAADIGMPIKHLVLDIVELRTLYQCGAAIIRPDLMVAWRSNVRPNDSRQLLDIIRGAGTSKSVS